MRLSYHESGPRWAEPETRLGFFWFGSSALGQVGFSKQALSASSCTWQLPSLGKPPKSGSQMNAEGASLATHAL